MENVLLIVEQTTGKIKMVIAELVCQVAQIVMFMKHATLVKIHIILMKIRLAILLNV
jgi:hypothetical protein